MANVNMKDYFNPTEKQREALRFVGKGKKIFFGGARGGGKMESLDSKILTPKGWETFRDIKVGDTISCPSTGGSQKVIAVHPQGKMDLYKITFDDGASCLVGKEHLWAYKRPNHQRPSTKQSSERDYAIKELNADISENRWHNLRVGTTAEIAELLTDGERVRMPLTEPVIFTMNGMTGRGDVDPYILGLFLGDGYLKQAVITNKDEEILSYLEGRGFKRITGKGKKCDSAKAIGKAKDIYDNWFRNNHIIKCLAWEKFIPKYILTSPLAYRVSFLQGLLDSDGYADERGRCYYSTTSEKLADGFIELIRSIGGKVFLQVKPHPQYTYKGEKRTGRKAYDIQFITRKNSNLFRLTRKKKRCTDSWNDGYENMRAVEKIEYHGNEEAMCITVSHPLGLYITDDFIVTHNSALGLGSAVMVADQFPGIKVVIVRKTYPELVDNFVNPLLELYPKEVFQYKYLKQDKIAYFKNNSKIIFKACENEIDAERVQGLEYQYMIIDEANNFDDITIQKMTGSARNSRIKNFIPTLLMTGNPGGRADLYFKTRFVNPDYSYWRENELTMKDNHVFVSARVEDNPHINKEYVQWLESLEEGLRKAWREGDWDVFQGQFFSEFNPNVHVVEDFEIPKDWIRKCGIDIGYSISHPTVCLWTAQDPKTMDVFVYREYSGPPAGEGGANERYAYDIKSLQYGDVPNIMWADPSAFNKTSGHDSPAFYFLREGMLLKAADNERVNGWRSLKQWFHWTQEHGPKLKIFRSCLRTIQILPTMRFAQHTNVHREDLDTRQSLDDYADALRYVMHSGYLYPTATFMASHDTVGKFEGRERSIFTPGVENKQLSEIYISTDRTFCGEVSRRHDDYAMKRDKVYIHSRAMF